MQNALIVRAMRMGNPGHRDCARQPLPKQLEWRCLCPRSVPGRVLVRDRAAIRCEADGGFGNRVGCIPPVRSMAQRVIPGA
jgi:hypothetical protein